MNPGIGPSPSKDVSVSCRFGETRRAPKPVERRPLQAHPHKRGRLCVSPTATDASLMNCWGVYSELDPEPNHDRGCARLTSVEKASGAAAGAAPGTTTGAAALPSMASGTKAVEEC